MPLTQPQIRHLRKLAHSLKPVILVGQKGVTPALEEELAIALDHHELLKVRIATEDKAEFLEILEGLANRAGADIVQAIGRVGVLFKRNPEKPRVALS